MDGYVRVQEWTTHSFNVLLGLHMASFFCTGSNQRSAISQWNVIAQGSLLLAIGCLALPAIAQETEPIKSVEALLSESFEGEEDFEEASRMRLNIATLDDLKEVIGLLESAMKKGLDPDDLIAAKKLIAFSYVQKTELLMKNLAQSKVQSQTRRVKLVNEFLEDLNLAVANDPTLADAYLLKLSLHAQLQDIDGAYETANAGVNALVPMLSSMDRPTKAKLSELLILRAGLRPEKESSLEDLKLSVETEPTNLKAITILRLKSIQESKVDETVRFFEKVLETSSENEALICTTAEMMALDNARIQESLDLLGEKLKLMPKSVELRKSRARVYSMNKQPDLAKLEMDEAMKNSPQDIDSLLLRAELLIAETNSSDANRSPDELSVEAEKIEAARKDVDTAYELDKNRVGTVLLRANIAAIQKRYGDAISDYQMILKAQPKDSPKDARLLMQLAAWYSLDNRPTQVIKIMNQFIKSYPNVGRAYQMRGDTKLGLGDHQAAIEDLEKALELTPEDDDKSGLFNNLSWVLATSPNDELRDGKRALEYALEACKLTNYEKPHILSTLAAAYAESGDFEKAIEWSTKGVDLARETDEEHLEQLEGELKSYQDKKPWREKTETKENKAPIVSSDAGVDS
jgi:tetratricopeptide (TPR) repeat protein